MSWLNNYEICAKLLLAILWEQNLYKKILGVTAIEIVYDLYTGQHPEVTTILYHMHVSILLFKR